MWRSASYRHLMWEYEELRNVWQNYNELRMDNGRLNKRIFVIGEVGMVNKVKMRVRQEMIQIKRQIKWTTKHVEKQ